MKRKEGVEKVKMDEKRTEGVRGSWEMPSSFEQGQGRGREHWSPTEAGYLPTVQTHTLLWGAGGSTKTH